MMTSDTNRRRSSVRRAFLAGVAIFGVLTLMAVAALAWTSSAFHRSIEVVIRDGRSRALASELEVGALMYSRLGNVLVLTGDPEVVVTRDALAADMRGWLIDARRYVGSSEESDLLDQVEDALTHYMAERVELERRGLQAADVREMARPSFERALARLEELRDLNDVQVETTYARAARLDELSNGISLAAVVAFGLGATALGLGMRRYLVRPMLDLDAAIARFRAGDHAARASAAGPRELADLATSFNEMAESLIEQRRQQLTFLAGVAHDLRGPLGGLKLGLHAFEHQDSAHRRDKTRAALDRQVDFLARMVEDLLDATRIEAGELELRIEEFDAREVVDVVVDLHSATSPSSRIEASTPPRPVWTRADPHRIEQVLMNLVSNAIKFSPSGGLIRVVLQEADDDLTLTVADRGVGMSSEDMRDMFLPFRRRRPDVAPGAGLGLSVVRRIVDAHHGSIEVESTPGAGSTFTVRIPRGRAREATAVAESAE